MATRTDPLEAIVNVSWGGYYCFMLAGLGNPPGTAAIDFLKGSPLFYQTKMVFIDGIGSVPTAVGLIKVGASAADAVAQATFPGAEDGVSGPVFYTWLWPGSAKQSDAIAAAQAAFDAGIDFSPATDPPQIWTMENNSLAASIYVVRQPHLIGIDPGVDGNTIPMSYANGGATELQTVLWYRTDKAGTGTVYNGAASSPPLVSLPAGPLPLIAADVPL